MSKGKTILHDWARMCDTFEGENCSKCPLKQVATPDDCFCFALDLPDEASAVILKWVEENPVKTYKMDFLEKFPNAPLEADGNPEACRALIYGAYPCSDRSCAECWNEPMEVTKSNDTE